LYLGNQSLPKYDILNEFNNQASKMESLGIDKEAPKEEIGFGRE